MAAGGNYNIIARFYDGLAKMVFGNQQMEAQVFLLKTIPPEAQVLIAGGGTGRILEEIARVHHSGLKITYIDSSAAMIRIAQKRQCGINQVVFITAPIQDVCLDPVFDVIITPFLFDNFVEHTGNGIWLHLDSALVAGGRWLITDFVKPGAKQKRLKFLVSVMYLFFNLVCGVEARGLWDFTKPFSRNNYTLAIRKRFFMNFIESVTYEKAF